MQGTVNILGIPFSKLTLEETTHQLTEHIHSRHTRMFHLITANPEIAIAHQSDELLQTIIREADLITPDGIGIVLAARRKGEPIPERVTGYDLLLRMLDKGNSFGWSFYFLGTDEETSVKAVEQIRRLYPKIRIAGRHHGFFKEDGEWRVLQELRYAKPDVLIVAMGAPYSDKWIYHHRKELAEVKVVFGVGGSLDVIAGKVKPAPEIWRKLHLEWLHRLLTAPTSKGRPSRWRRQTALPKFFFRAIVRR